MANQNFNIQQMDYFQLKGAVEKIIEAHKETYLDSMWLGIVGSNKNKWRLYKSNGFEKDSYYGWILVSTSVNSNGYELYQKIQKLINNYPELEIKIVSRQL